MEFPFVRCFGKPYRDRDGTGGVVYYLANNRGDCEEVARSVVGDGIATVYEGSVGFAEKYGYFFPIGSIGMWDSEEGMLAWVDKMLWFSFLCKSGPNTGLCWFIKEISTDTWRGYTFLPDWAERFRNSSECSVWVLLKNGRKVWPAHIVHNQLGEGWSDFWASHKLRCGFKIVFGCERTWIFDAVVLAPNLEPMHYAWSSSEHEFQESSLMPFVVDDLGTPENLLTSCIPSMMSTKDNIMQFGYVYMPVKCIFKSLGKRFRDFCHDVGVTEIFLHMRSKWWSLDIVNGRVDRTSLQLFLNALNLQPFEFLLVTAFDPTDVNVIVFSSDGTERLYGWM